MADIVECKANGRPLLFKSVEELEAKIQEYFDSTKRKRIVTTKSGATYEEEYELPKTVSGLAVALDCDRRTLLNYRNRDAFFPTLARAKAICQNYAVDQLFLGNDRGAKFVLINDHKAEDWADRTEVNTTLTIDSADAIAQARDRARLLATERLAQIPCGQQTADYIDVDVIDKED